MNENEQRKEVRGRVEELRETGVGVHYYNLQGVAHARLLCAGIRFSRPLYGLDSIISTLLPLCLLSFSE